MKNDPLYLHKKIALSRRIRGSEESFSLPEKVPPKAIQLSKKAIVIAIVVVLVLVITAYILTFVLPTGEYQRDAEGSIIQGTYVEKDMEGIAWWQVILSPVMILSPASDGFLVVYTIIALLLVIGAIFTVLDDSGILIYMIESVGHRFKNKKYLLLSIVMFAFMFLGSAVGMFEELIPLVPIVVMLCYALGWDALVGLGASILAGCLGFAAGVVNPFTVGVAQTLAPASMGITLFSGIGMRLLTFGVAYVVLFLAVIPYARRVEKKPSISSVFEADTIRKREFNFNLDTFKPDKKKGQALIWFGAWMLFIIVCAVTSIFYHPLADYVMYITVAVYVIAGIGSAILCGMKAKKLFRLLGKGMLTLLPAVFMILIAGGVRYIIEEGDVMDTILYKAIGLIQNQSKPVAIILLYLIVIVFEIFIPSGSAKALLLMPIIYDICMLLHIDGQVAVLLFSFADGFGNIILPTNAGLLLILGMTTVDYPKWLRWSIRILLPLFIATIGILMLAQYVIYA